MTLALLHFMRWLNFATISSLVIGFLGVWILSVEPWILAHNTFPLPLRYRPMWARFKIASRLGISRVQHMRWGVPRPYSFCS